MRYIKTDSVECLEMLMTFVEEQNARASRGDKGAMADCEEVFRRIKNQKYIAVDDFGARMANKRDFVDHNLHAKCEMKYGQGALAYGVTREIRYMNYLDTVRANPMYEFHWQDEKHCFHGCYMRLADLIAYLTAYNGAIDTWLVDHAKRGQLDWQVVNNSKKKLRYLAVLEEKYPVP